MLEKLSVIINTLNEEKNIERAIRSVKWADEIIVCDMHSDDQTQTLAKNLGAKIYLHKRVGFVEPARNFAISKASNAWVLILDADEEIPSALKERIQFIIDNSASDYVEIPRKNMIFNKWVQASMWWPDYNIRLFKKGKVQWGDKIHRPPQTYGKGEELEAKEELAIIHYHYISISQFMERMNRYTAIQAEELVKEEYIFKWQDLITKPLNEFLGRYFANKGYKDGLHGLVLCILQAISFFIMYLKVWEIQKFTQTDVNIKLLKSLKNDSGQELDYWFKYISYSSNPVKRMVQKLLYKFF